MSKYAAAIEMGWMDQCIEGDSPCDIIRQMEAVQDFGCLLYMGRMEEGPAFQEELDKLEAFLDKYHDGSLTMQDIEQLDIRLSIGQIVCHGIAENEEEVEILKKNML